MLLPPKGVSSLGDEDEDEANSMTDTLLTVQCEENVTCTALDAQPGATIVSPILLSLSGVTGQIWALYYLYTSTRPQHSRTVFFVLLSTLIWTDLVGKVITTTPALVAYAHGTWVGGVPMCNLHGFSMMLISLVTHLLVSTMAVERFIGIRHGYFYNKNITTSRTKMLLLCMWLFSVLFCAMPLFGVGQYALQYPGSWCYVNIHVGGASPLRHRVYTYVFGCFTLVSLVVMVVCNLVVITTLLFLRLCRERCCRSGLCAPHRASKQRELEMQMVIVLAVITVVFVLSWSPIDMRLFLNQLWPHSRRKDHLQDLIAVRLTSINQIVDPWAYIICRKVFMMRAWRWMRVSLVGSRLERLVVGRENSSRKAVAGIQRMGGGGGGGGGGGSGGGGGGGGGGSSSSSSSSSPPAGAEAAGRGFEKYRYKAPFARGSADEEAGEDVVVVMGETHHRHHHRHHHFGQASPPPTPPPQPPLPPAASPSPPASLTRELHPKEVIEIFRDSGTGSNYTPSTFCSDSCNALCDHSCHEASAGGHLGLGSPQEAEVPIPIFRSVRYRVAPPGGVLLLPPPPRLRRITSSASARAASASRAARNPRRQEGAGRPADWTPLVLRGRRHSWCCPLDGVDTKQYRTQSTQTFRSHHDDRPAPPPPPPPSGDDRVRRWRLRQQPTTGDDLLCFPCLDDSVFVVATGPNRFRSAAGSPNRAELHELC